jgi:hypothetical protein
VVADNAASRMVSIWDLVARRAAGRQARVSVQDVCAAAVAAIPVSGAGLVSVTPAGAVHVMCVTDEIVERLADIELTVGEGPRADVSASGGPLLASDLAHEDIMSRWPAFAPAALAAGAAGVFAFPLQIGAIRVGVLELYRRLPSPLSMSALGDALLFADTATLLLLDGHQAEGPVGPDRDAAGPGGPERAARGGPGGQPMEISRRRAEIDQATGMLTEQLGTGIAEAFARLRAYAYASDRQLADVAHDIVTRRLRLDGADEPGIGSGPADAAGRDCDQGGAG